MYAPTSHPPTSLLLSTPPPPLSLSLLPPQIMILLCNQQSFICTHIDFCHPRCYQHHSRSCARLVRAIKLVYGETVDSLREDSAATGNIGTRAKKNKEVGCLVFCLGGCSLTGDIYFFLQCSDKSCLRTPSMKRRPTDSNTEGKKDTGMLKYIRNQVTLFNFSFVFMGNKKCNMRKSEKKQKRVS